MIKNNILEIMRLISLELEKEIKTDTISSYIQQRGLINKIFYTTSTEYGNAPLSSILLRLIVLDSLYSTNASYSYFSFDNMANEISNIGNESKVVNYFYSLVEGKGDYEHLFDKKYGIRKNLSSGSLQMSLMSKYAYYQLLQHKKQCPLGFPIYDSLAVTMYPKVCKLITKSEVKIKSDTIGEYIESLNNLRKMIFGDYEGLVFETFQQYDLLDAYLWRMGKVNEGNFSLLFSEKDYKTFITNIGLSNTENLKDEKNIIIKEQKTYKNNQTKTIYKYHFNNLVKYQCSTMNIDDIVKGIEQNECIKAIIQHWRDYYINSTTE